VSETTLAPDFNPADVQICGIPLTATLGRTELEFTAACIVQALAERGNVWRPIMGSEIIAVLKALSEKSQYWKSLLTNPFLGPCPEELAEAGFAELLDDGNIRLTDKCIERLRLAVARPKGSTV
jgi:hypothetical protein